MAHDYSPDIGGLGITGEGNDLVAEVVRDSGGRFDGQGYQADIAANGNHNLRHYMNGMANGAVGVAGAMISDGLIEGGAKGLPWGTDEDAAELAGDRRAGQASLSLHSEVYGNSAGLMKLFFALDNDAWKRSRHVPGKLWRKYFCV